MPSIPDTAPATSDTAEPSGIRFHTTERIASPIIERVEP